MGRVSKKRTNRDLSSSIDDEQSTNEDYSLPWPYVSEIFPTRIREPGIAVGVASQWFVFKENTMVIPQALITCQ